jgi:DNA-binding response OmpR family regulator
MEVCMKIDESEKGKILIVDDESPVRSLLKRILVRKYVVLEASDGEEALGITHREKPELILMDIMMPKMDGYTACYRIKADQATKETPVIMLTAVGLELNKKLAMEIGANGYITKPFTGRDLMDVINSVLD